MEISRINTDFCKKCQIERFPDGPCRPDLGTIFTPWSICGPNWKGVNIWLLCTEPATHHKMCCTVKLREDGLVYVDGFLRERIGSKSYVRPTKEQYARLVDGVFDAIDMLMRCFDCECELMDGVCPYMLEQVVMEKNLNENAKSDGRRI